MDKNMEFNHTVLCKPNCCAGTLVMDTGPADDVPVDCSEGASASNMYDSNAPVTICCIDWTPYEYTVESEEETDIRKAFVLSQKQVTLQNNDISVNKEEIFRDSKAFTIDDDEASHSKSLFRDCASHRRDINYSNYSYKAMTVENSEIATVHNEGDGDDKPHNHQLTILSPSSSKKFIQKNINVVNVHKFEQRVTGYNIKPIYPILIGNSVQVCPTNLFTLLPQYDKFLVKERLHDPSTGFTKSKLVLKSCSTEAEHNCTSDGMSYHHPIVPCNSDNDNNDNNDDVISVHCKHNYDNPHCIIMYIYTSNIMIKMRCHCRPLECSCSSRFQVKLGDFDSAGTVPGLGITEPTDQVIEFASILPLGIPGYRAPEVFMHITLSGPYETLYTTAVDMWSLGYLCLNMCIGKIAALKQTEETSLLLSRTCTKLWEGTIKINELMIIKPFSYDPELLRIVEYLLQVPADYLPKRLLKYFIAHDMMQK